MAFTGREQELARLAGAIERAADGRPGRVVLTGPAGIGVSRLLDELALRIERVPGVVLARGTALAPASLEPWQAVADALGGALAALPDAALPAVVGDGGDDLARLLPALGPRLDRLAIPRDPPALDAPDQVGARVSEAVLGALERLAGPGVVLLVLEDLHHADPATRAFIRTLLRIERPLPICLVLAWQPDEIGRRHPARELLELAAASPDLETIALGPLAALDVERLAEAAAGTPIPGDLLAAIVAGAAGDPLVALQLLAARDLPVAGVRLSDPFPEVVAGRLAALADPARRLVRLLAAARQPLPRAAVLDPAVADGRVTPVAIDEAIAARLVTERAGDLAIVHERVAEAIEDEEPPHERSALHAALARALAAQPARSAWHWEAAGRRTEALAAHRMAADAAALLDPGRTTLAHLVPILEPQAGEPGGPAPDELPDLLIRAARAHAADGAFRRAAELHRRAAAALAGVADARGERDDAWRLATAAILEEVAHAHAAAGDPVLAQRALDDALALLPAGPSAVRARLLAALAQRRMIEGRFAESARDAEAAIAVAREVGDDARRELGHATCTLGVDIAYLGHLERGLALLAEADATARAARRLDDLVRVAANRTTLLDLDARRAEALAVVEAGIADAAAGRLAGTYGSFLRGNAADILFQLGRWDDSERECRAGMEWQPAGVAWFSPSLYLGLVLAEARADEEAAALLGRTLLQLETLPAGQWSALVQRTAVSLALWRGDPADALRVAAREWPRILETEDPLQIALGASTTLEAAAAAAEHARADHLLALLAEARELAEPVLSVAPERIRAGDLPPGIAAHQEAQLHLETARAHAARLQGRASPAGWAALADAWLARGLPYPAAKARWWEALAHLDGEPDRAGAEAAIAAAWAIARPLPARPLLRALADLGRRARLRLPADAAAFRRAVAVPVVPPPGRAVAPGLAGLIAPASLAAAAPRPVVAVPVEDAPMEVAGVGGLAAGTAGEVGTPLTPRELDVLRLICEGRSDREIGERLYISERTVQVHVRHVLGKMGVSSRTQAASLALRSGVVPVADPVSAGLPPEG